MTKSRHSKKSKRRSKAGKNKERDTRTDTPGNLRLSSPAIPELPGFDGADTSGHINDIDPLPNVVHLIGYTNSVEMQVIRVCRYWKQGSSNLDPTSLAVCGFDITRYGALEVPDVWIYPPEELEEKYTAWKGVNWSGHDAASETNVSPCLPFKAERAEALTLHEVAFSPAQHYVFRLFKDKPIWEMTRAIRENITGGSNNGTDWSYSFRDWRPLVQDFCRLRNKFNRDIRTIEDFLTSGLDLIRQAAALVCHTQAFDWMLGEIILQDYMLDRGNLVYRDELDKSESKHSYITNRQWLEIIKEDPLGEEDGDGDGADDFSAFICYRDRAEKVTWMFDNYDGEERMRTIWDLQQASSREDPVVYIGDSMTADTPTPWLPDRSLAEVLPEDGDAQPAQKASDRDHDPVHVGPLEESFGPLPERLQRLADEIAAITSNLDWAYHSFC